MWAEVPLLMPLEKGFSVEFAQQTSRAKNRKDAVFCHLSLNQL
jgi:hypothetical protein